MSQKDVLKQIKRLTDQLIIKNFITRQNYPANKNNEIAWAGYKNLSFTLKDESYSVLYENLLKESDFNLLMLDGAIIQFKYKFYKDQIIEHVLSFYPCPDFDRYQDDPDFFEDFVYSSNEMFADMISGKILCAPIRFDYNNSVHVDVDHPKSHLTVGNYLDCRIPVSKPITPNRFINFILRNFYFKKYKEAFQPDFFNCKIFCDSSITEKEKKLLHISWS